MTVTFLGTGAGESYPGLWCQCPHCSYARRVRGRNIRANSCAVLDEKVLLDIGPMCFDAAARLGVNLTGVTTLLITHCHEDHLYPMQLYWRKANENALGMPFHEQMLQSGPRFTVLPELKVFGNRYTQTELESILSETPSAGLRFTLIQTGMTFESDGYWVTPVQGNHQKEGFAHGYVIEKEGKTLLYALDTGMYEPDMKALLANFKYDAVIMEGTTGLRTQYEGHMCFETNQAFREWLLEKECLKKDTPFVLTHLSPHWCPPHDFYAPMVEAQGMILAYDGMTMTI